MAEMVAVMAVIALMASLIVPTLRAGTGRSDLQALALEVTALLRATRLNAVTQQEETSFILDTRGLSMRSTALPDRTIAIPADVSLTHEISSRCRRTRRGIEVVFLKDGRSCGSQITLGIDGFRAVVQTNWLVGKTNVRFEP